MATSHFSYTQISCYQDAALVEIGAPREQYPPPRTPQKTSPNEPMEPTLYAVLGSGGWLGLIKANATWIMPPARPSATPMRQAMV
jgi:hypothetical protein